jgi:multiple sugar transport system substrate-binding protein
MRRVLVPFLLAAAVAAAATLSACGSSGGDSGGDTGDVVMWHGYDQQLGKVTADLVDRFNATQPGFTVKQRYAGPSDDALAKTLTSITAGNFPDVVYLFGSDMATIARSPKVATWNDYIAAHPEFDWEDFFPGARAAATVNGNVVGVPALVDNLALVYNKRLFAEAGIDPPTAAWTWDDFRQAAKQLSDQSEHRFGWAYPVSGDEDTTWRYLALLWQAGGDLLTPDDAKSAFDSPAGVKALTLLRQMAVEDRSIYTFQTADSSKYLSLFNAGKIGMLWTGPWDLGSINADVEYGVQILPGDVNHSSISGPDMWATLNHGPKSVASAQAFLADYTSAKRHLEYAIQTGDLPIRQSETELPDYKGVYLKKYPEAEVFVQNLEDNVAKARPALPAYTDVSKALGEAVASVLLGKAEPAEALHQAAQEADAALAEER